MLFQMCDIVKLEARNTIFVQLHKQEHKDCCIMSNICGIYFQQEIRTRD